MQTTTTRPTRGSELDLSVESLAYGGAGVARLDSYVVFVEGAVPGDRVRAVVSRAKRSYAYARATEILDPGADRVDPVADHPGAAWQVLAYGRQLEVKQAQVEDALRRLGGLDGFALEPIVPAAEQWRYRNKLEYSFGGGPGDRLQCGFHAPGRWDEIVDYARLPAGVRGRQTRPRERVVALVPSAAPGGPYDRALPVEGLLRNLVVREGRRTGWTCRFGWSRATEELDRQDLGDRRRGPRRACCGPGLLPWAEVTQGRRDGAGRRVGVARGGPARDALRLSPEAFFQTNTEMAERLFQIAIEFAHPSGFERLYDLYCGIGTIGLLMAPRVGEVLGLEIAPEAVADAIVQRPRQRDRQARFYAGDVRLALRELVARAGRPDLLVVDPPRAGLSKKVVRRIIEASPRRIVYVSCNPTTLAPNAAQLEEAGYKLTRVRPVDMFPQTPHIECVALLERSG